MAELNVLNNENPTEPSGAIKEQGRINISMITPHSIGERELDAEYISTAIASSIASNGWSEESHTWTYSSVDGATGVLTVDADLTGVIQAGDRIWITQTTSKYFIVTKAPTYSSPNTTITMWGGTDYTLANAAITAPYYSRQYNPFGFNTSPTKWTIQILDTTDVTQNAPVNGTWYNLGSLSAVIHIGVWNVTWQVNMNPRDVSNTAGMSTTLSSANNSQSDAELTAKMRYNQSNVTSQNNITPATRQKVLTLTTKTTYYLNSKSDDSVDDIFIMGSAGTTVIKAVSAFI